MKIYAMEATFGKLEGERLELTEGFQTVYAPNEWGKSTWCAFLLAMLYGLDTRAKTTKTVLADKERYAPWSGKPMAGRLEISWQGRDITIERRTRGRVPLGEFRAWETHSGLPVPELTAANCGQTLLGVEKSVYRRGGFIRLEELPLTEDQALRRRLQNLVATGEDSAEADRLEKALRDLKNRCRYNRSGLIPQAQEERYKLESNLEQLLRLEERCGSLRRQLAEGRDRREELRRHLQHLDYAQAEADARQVALAGDRLDLARQELERLERETGLLPPPGQIREKLAALERYREKLAALERQEASLPQLPREPELPPPFTGLTPAAAEGKLEADRQRYAALRRPYPWGWLTLALSLGGGVGLALLEKLPLALGIGLGLAGLSVLFFTKKKARRRGAEDLERIYGSHNPDRWGDGFARYRRELEECRRQEALWRSARSLARETRLALEKEGSSLCGGQTPDRVAAVWRQALDRWEALDRAKDRYFQAESHREAVGAMARQAVRPVGADSLDLPREETLALLEELEENRRDLGSRLAQTLGRMEALGDRETLRQELQRVTDRLAALEKTCAAVELALETLLEARRELQRRFAPRITRRASALLEDLTDGRYRQLRLGEDLTLSAAAGEEQTLTEVLWRSAGTVDQLYLCLRLAVAQELTPGAPLILDDVLARFDDKRCRAALEMLRDLGKDRQVILFTCRKREQ